MPCGKRLVFAMLSDMQGSAWWRRVHFEELVGRRSFLMAQRLGPLQTMFHRCLHSMCSPAVSFVLHQANALAVQKGRPQAAQRPCRLTACLARLKTPQSSATRQQGIACIEVSVKLSAQPARTLHPPAGDCCTDPPRANGR